MREREMGRESDAFRERPQCQRRGKAGRGGEGIWS